MIVNVIGGFSLFCFVIQCFIAPFVMSDYNEMRKTLWIDNSLLLIAAAICFK